MKMWKLELEDVGKLTTNGATFNIQPYEYCTKEASVFSSSSGYVSIEMLNAMYHILQKPEEF